MHGTVKDDSIVPSSLENIFENKTLFVTQEPADSNFLATLPVFNNDFKSLATPSPLERIQTLCSNVVQPSVPVQQRDYDFGDYLGPLSPCFLSHVYAFPDLLQDSCSGLDPFTLGFGTYSATSNSLPLSFDQVINENPPFAADARVFARP